MALSENAAKRLAIATTDRNVGAELANAINSGGGQSHLLVGAIVATNVSQTIDFGVLLPGDHVVMIPATAGNADFISPAVAGTLGQAAVVGNIYLVFRAVPAAVSVVF